MSRQRAQRPYETHGIEFDSKLRGDEALADSPFDPSNKSDKFHLNIKTKQWHDKKLARGGGLAEFLAAMQEHVYGEALTHDRLTELADHRKLPVSAFDAWRDILGYDASRSAYTLVCHDPVSRRPCNIYWWKTDGTQWCTAEASAGIFGGHTLATLALTSPIYLCEGPWDAIAMNALLTRALVKGRAVAVPGVGIFNKEWVPAFQGRDVRVCYDNDEAAKKADARVASLLTGRVESIRYLHWPDTTPAKWDLRDEIIKALRAKQSKKCWKRLLKWLRDDPRRQPDPDDAPELVSCNRRN